METQFKPNILVSDFINLAMVGGVATGILLTLLPTLVYCSGEGNIRLLEDEVASALKACSEVENPSRETQRHERSADESTRIDAGNKQGSNQYSHERRNVTDVRDQMFVINSTDYDYEGYGSGNVGEKLMNPMPRTTADGSYPNVDGNVNNLNRTRRSEPLLSKADNVQVITPYCAVDSFLGCCRRRLSHCTSRG